MAGVANTAVGADATVGRATPLEQPQTANKKTAATENLYAILIPPHFELHDHSQTKMW
jgi:hypothetical protein